MLRSRMRACGPPDALSEAFARPPFPGSALHADDLLQTRDDLDEIRHPGHEGDGGRIAQFVEPAYQDEKTIDRFVSIFSYVSSDATDPSKWGDLGGSLRDDPKIVRAFYMAIAPDRFGPTCEYIAKQGY